MTPQEEPPPVDLRAMRTTPIGVIRALMNHYEVESSKVADLLQVDQSSVRSKLLGRREFRHEELYMLTRFFRIPFDVLYGSREEAIRYVLDHPDPRPQPTSPGADMKAPARRSRAARTLRKRELWCIQSPSRAIDEERAAA